MLELTRKLSHGDRSPQPAGVLRLALAARQKGRLRAALDDGTEVGLFLERGGTLEDGDRLTGEHGRVIVVRAAPEAVSTVRHLDPRTLARAAYHLGNRHTPLEVGEGWLRYLEDHVLDAMCERLGLEVEHQTVPFHPESGAYSGHDHGHHHG